MLDIRVKECSKLTTNPHLVLCNVRFLTKHYRLSLTTSGGSTKSVGATVGQKYKKNFCRQSIVLFPIDPCTRTLRESSGVSRVWQAWYVPRAQF